MTYEERVPATDATTRWKVGDRVRVIDPSGHVPYRAVIVKVSKVRVTTAIDLGGDIRSLETQKWNLDGFGYGQGIYNDRRIELVQVTL